MVKQLLWLGFDLFALKLDIRGSGCWVRVPRLRLIDLGFSAYHLSLFGKSCGAKPEPLNLKHLG